MKESDQDFYHRRVKRAIDELRQLQENPSNAFTERVLILGVTKEKAPTVYVRESIEELTAHWKLELLNFYREGQERNFSIPTELLPYRSKSQFDYIIEKKLSDSKKDTKSIKQDFRTIKSRANRHRMLTIGHAIISLVYLGFRCGFFYRVIGVSISNGKLKIDSTRKMSTAHILNECNKSGSVSKIQELLISSFIAGYESHISRNIQSTSRPPYEPKNKVIIELSHRLVEEQMEMKLTPEVLYNLLLTICPRGNAMINSINRTPGKFVIINGVERGISTLEDAIDDQEVYSKNPRLSSLYFSHADIPLLTAMDKYWKDDPANFYIHWLESNDITEKDIDELNQSLKA